MPSFSCWTLPISSIDSAGIYADRSAFRDLFRTREELEEQEGVYPVGGNRFSSPSGDWVPLYEGKMVQAFDHRAGFPFPSRRMIPDSVLAVKEPRSGLTCPARWLSGFWFR